MKNFKELRIGITGTPGTGKKTIGKELAKIIGLQYVSINEVAIRLRAGRWEKGEFLVDISKLRGKIETGGKVVCGHLLPHVVPSKDIDYVVVLRCSPRVLRKRYSKRNYSHTKISENIESEFLDIIFSKSLSTYGTRNVYEFDTTRTKSPRRAAERILKMLEGKLPRHSGRTNWTYRASESPRKLELVLGWS